MRRLWSAWVRPFIPGFVRRAIRKRIANSRERLIGFGLNLKIASIERELGLASGTITGNRKLVIAQRKNELLAHFIESGSSELSLASGITAHDAMAKIRSGAISRIILIARSHGEFGYFDLPHVFKSIRKHLNWTGIWLNRFVQVTKRTDRPIDRLESIRVVQANGPLIDFLGAGELPFAMPECMPSHLWAEPKRRSALLLNNCYYYYEVLASALRARGWDVHTASFEPPDSPSRKFFWNKEEIVYDADPVAHRRKVAAFFSSAAERFGAIQLYGQFQMSCFRENWSLGDNQKVPWDFLELRRRGIVIGYTPSGCLDGARQSAIRRVSGDMCASCVWENQPSVCSDDLNGRWAQQLELMCDWVGLENDYAVDERTGPRYVRRPVVTGLDPSIWKPDLVIPDNFKIDRKPGEIIVYHAFGNSRLRQSNGKDVKGSGSILAAVERLRGEGVPLKLFYATDISTTEVRFYQAQADIVVDQLLYGRLGSNAREALMLGRPLVARIEALQVDREEPLDTMATVPAASADEETVYEVLRRLAGDAEMRREMGKRSREYALKWHSDEVCAARFEKIVDRARAGLPVDIDEHPHV
jgi:hypothetical protein